MSDNIVAVINDNTGEIYAYLKGCSSWFPHNAWIEADEIKQIRQFGSNLENKAYIIRWEDMSQVVDTRNYSVIEVAE